MNKEGKAMKIKKSFRRLMLSLALAFMAVGMLVVPSAVRVNADENTAVTEERCLTGKGRLC